MSPEEARTIAESYLGEQQMRGYKAVFAEVRNHPRWPQEFSVIFDLYEEEDLVDGPMIVIVDKETGKARGFESP